MANLISLLLSYLFGFVLFLALPSEAAVSGNDQFVRVNNVHFVVNGKTFLFNGFNSYWLMLLATQPNNRFKVSKVFQEASANGLSVCRTWAFNDGGFNALQIKPGVYNEQTFQALDFIISEAKKYGIRLILSFVNNYNDFGGKAKYVQWARDAGAQISRDDDFYTHPVPKKFYKDHIRKVVTRFNTITRVAYKDEPTIMAWELMNEPRCQVDNSGRTVNGWVQEMAAFVKSLDNKHLLEVGMEGFYGDSMPNKKQFNPGFQVGTDFISNHQIPEIDFATIHAYADQWLSGKDDQTQLLFLQRWLLSHWNDARNILKKPLVLAEFGKSNKDRGYSLSVRDKFVSTVYTTTYGFAKSGGTMAGCLIWQLMAPATENLYDGYEIVLSQSPSTSKIVSFQSRAMKNLALLIKP